MLLGEDVFYPYMPAVTTSVQTVLNAETAAARRAGFPIKVALIASPIDLGVIPELFGHPQQYAAFLDREISFQGPHPLLVVMAAGYGVQGTGGPAGLALAGLPPPAEKTSTALARAAITAVARLTKASGHRLEGGFAAPTPTAGGGGGSSTTPIVIALAVAAVAAAGTLIARRRRSAAPPAR